MNRLIVTITALLCMLAPPLAHAGAKLIHYGWDNPYISELPQVVPKFKKSLFDGISIGADNYIEIFRATAFHENVHDGDKATLRKLDRTLFKNSYILVHSKTDGVFDWANDQHWQAAMTNMRLLVNLAKFGGFKGIVFDMEPYGKNPWDYGTQPAASRLSYPEMASLLRRRGADMMRMMQTEYPGIQIWCLYGITAQYSDNEEVAAGMTVAKALEQSGSGLWASFYTGWVQAANAKTSIIDGNEPSYYHTRRADFEWSRGYVRNTLAKFIDADVRAKYKAKVKLGHAVYTDAVMNTHKSPRYIGYYFKTDAERAKLLYSNTLNALETSESLVWVYAENAKWWKAPPRPLMDNALRNAKRDAARNKKPPAPSVALKAAEKGVKEAVIVGGTITSADGAGVQPKAWGTALNNAACVTWGDRGGYSCTYPKGATITITPKIDGKALVPPSRTFNKLSETSWSVNWAAE
jgi:hypothetical protein